VRWTGAGRRRAWGGSGLKKLRAVAHRWCKTCAGEVRDPGPSTAVVNHDGEGGSARGEVRQFEAIGIL